MQAMGRILPKITKKSLGRRDVALAGLMENWGDIVGGEISQLASPFKIVWPRDNKGGGVLHLRVSGAGALLLQHSVPQILMRLNSYFGHAAIGELRFMQGVAVKKKKVVANDFYARCSRVKKASGVLPMGEAAKIAADIEHIDDDGLREALQGLGESVRGQK